jgi:sarcosine oxidase, subunit gamma
MFKPSNAPIMQSPLHALGLDALAKPIDQSAGVWANEASSLGYMSLRGASSDADFVAAASKALGLALPIAPCSYKQTGAAKVMWLSPDEWMIACPRDRHPALLADLNGSLKGLHSQVTDNSGGFTQIIVMGRNARDALSHCTVYDLALLGEGRVVGTTFGKSTCYMHPAGDGYCLLVRRSFADYIWRYLERAAQPYGFGIAKFGAGQLGAAA